MTNRETALEALASAWVKAKTAEIEANALRVSIENEIIAITGAKDEGRETHTLPEPQTHRNRKADIQSRIRAPARTDRTMARPIPGHQI
jgi:non-homologous end joining protein Ku